MFSISRSSPRSKKKVLFEIASKRYSGIKAEAVSAFKDFYRIYSKNDVTEATFKAEILKCMIINDFQVLAKPGDPANGIEPIYKYRNILKAGIFCQRE